MNFIINISGLKKVIVKSIEELENRKCMYVSLQKKLH